MREDIGKIVVMSAPGCGQPKECETKCGECGTEAILAIIFPAFAKWLRSRYTPVGNGYNITAADLDRLDEGKAPFGMSE